MRKYLSKAKYLIKLNYRKIKLAQKKQLSQLNQFFTLITLLLHLITDFFNQLGSIKISKNFKNLMRTLSIQDLFKCKYITHQQYILNYNYFSIKTLKDIENQGSNKFKDNYIHFNKINNLQNQKKNKFNTQLNILSIIK